ncbi:hypothetical protein GGR50DRAFT_697770 [Xylaria sp. CBS 124048]|nr:hypothetical protein GGR50DRAFT_697770 [Xylaria sp. CBS 124048]
MKLSSSAYLFHILAASVVFSSRLLSLPDLFTKDSLQLLQQQQQQQQKHQQKHQHQHQHPIPVIMDTQTPMSQSNVLISDVMARDRSVNVFAGFARDSAAVSKLLNSEAAHSTVLAPLNSAFDKLPGKAWENSRDYGTLGATAYEGDEGRDRARRNLERLVEAHVIPVSPWPEKQKVRSLLDGDGEIWWENRDGAMVIQPDGIEIQSVASKVGNEIKPPLDQTMHYLEIIAVALAALTTSALACTEGTYQCNNPTDGSTASIQVCRNGAWDLAAYCGEGSKCQYDDATGCTCV